MNGKRRLVKIRGSYRSNKKGLLLTAMLLGAAMPAWADTAGTLTTLYNTKIQPIIRIVFLIGVAIALIRVVLAMMNSGERSNIGSKIAWLVGGVLLYVLWETLLTDIGVNTTTGGVGP
jgi:hypothetical protein